MTNNLINFPILGNLVGNLHSPQGSCNSQNNLLEKVGYGLLFQWVIIIFHLYCPCKKKENWDEDRTLHLWVEMGF
jgi:hypothetical protein